MTWTATPQFANRRHVSTTWRLFRFGFSGRTREGLLIALHNRQKEIEALTATVKEQAAQILKVSAQLAAASPSRGGLELIKALPQTVLNN